MALFKETTKARNTSNKGQVVANLLYAFMESF